MPDKLFDPIPTRHSLLARLKDWGDQTSWQDFFDTYWRLIYNVAVKAGLTDAEAQEVVQETVIAVARKIPEFKTDPAHGSFSAWLMRLTRWRIADQLRRRSTVGVHASACPSDQQVQGTLKRGHPQDDTAMTDTMDRIADPAGMALESVWQEEWERHLMAAALEQVKRLVSPRQYQMFDLHVLQKLSVQETARTVQASVASVYMAKFRVGMLLRREVRNLEKARQ
jgi:RNA polymerase sigma-70 factor (ECF subfamily)